MTTTIYVSIGRNIGKAPMARPSWNNFAEEVVYAVEDYHGNIFFRGYGQGAYDGTTEDSYVVGATIAEGMLIHLRTVLAELAEKYSQECIALVSGDTDFIGATNYDGERS